VRHQHWQQLGYGHVLPGFLEGLLAQGLGAFDAASNGYWLHGQAAFSFSPALIEQDLAEQVSGVLRGLQIAGNNK
jgi:NAD(P)H-hydrate repair Nnr-like enzyme with NAD(P)H-hydrate dehydratase domain